MRTYDAKKIHWDPDHAVGKWRTFWYRCLFFLHRGQKEYCIQCLPSTGYYPYWLINTRRARLKPVGECKHGLSKVLPPIGQCKKCGVQLIRTGVRRIACPKCGQEYCG